MFFYFEFKSIQLTNESKIFRANVNIFDRFAIALVFTHTNTSIDYSNISNLVFVRDNSLSLARLL